MKVILIVMSKGIIRTVGAFLAVVWLGGCVSAQHNVPHIKTIVCKPSLQTPNAWTPGGPRLILPYEDGQQIKVAWYYKGSKHFIQLETNSVHTFELHVRDREPWEYTYPGGLLSPYGGRVISIKKSGKVVWKNPNPPRRSAK